MAKKVLNLKEDVTKVLWNIVGYNVKQHLGKTVVGLMQNGTLQVEKTRVDTLLITLDAAVDAAVHQCSAAAVRELENLLKKAVVTEEH